MPFRTAIKLPVFIYGRVRLFGLNGKVMFENTPIYRGMVKIGLNADSFGLFDHSGFIQLGSHKAVLIFEGPASISVNSKIRLCAGELRFGKYVYIGEGVRIICNGESVYIGEYARIAYGTIIMNSGFHHVYNSNKQSITRTTRPIIIGKNTWIGNRSSITAGAILKEKSIVCANSLINKDYTTIDGENPMLGGIPAKVIRCGFKRIFSPQYEEMVIQWFNEHPSESIYYVEQFEDNINDINSEFE
jgi:acetyltransferase-like isoleucine patch superfamily enzyme